jgi:serine/threonine-protein kinase
MQHLMNRQDSRSASTRAPESAPRPASAEPHDLERDELLDQLSAGTVVDERYRIDETLGRGAMGVVVAATHVQLNERVALKFLDTRIRVTVDDFYARFRREARVSARLRSDHVARVIDTGLYLRRHPYMVMDYLTGIDLKRAREAAGGAVPVELAVEYVVQICEGMAEAHALGIVHRDLKPANILVTKRADGADLIKILDFGISKWSAPEEQDDELTLTGVVLGSPKYMAPEQLFGAANVDARADVWSIGAMLYELLTGRPPFDAPSLTQICRELALNHAPPSMSSVRLGIAPAVEAVVSRCLVHEPNDRLANVAELAFALLEAIESPHASMVHRRLSAVLDPSTALAGSPESHYVRLSGTFVRQADGAYKVAGEASDTPPHTRRASWFQSAAQRRAFLLVCLLSMLVGGSFALYERAHVAAPTQVIAVSPSRPRAAEPVVSVSPLVPTTTALVAPLARPPAGVDAGRPGVRTSTAAVTKGVGAVANRAAARARPSAPPPAKVEVKRTAPPSLPTNPLEDRL